MADVSQPAQTVRVPFFGETDLRPGQEGFITKDQVYLNGFFEPIKVLDETNYHFVKRPGLSSFLTPTSGVGRGCYRWKQTGNLYSVNDSKIFSGTTNLGVTLSTTSGFVDFAETHPSAATQYLGVNDGTALYLIGSDDSVIVLNNVAITSSSIANPTHIVANNHGLNTGNKIIIRNHVGSTPSINDTIFTITRLDANTFTIPVNVTVGGTGGTIGVFPAPNTGDLHFMDTYWFTLKTDGSIWNCASQDPTTWPTTSFIFAQMLAGRGIGLAKQDNTLIAFTDKHFQMFFDAANPSGSPLSNIEEAMHQLGCVSPNAIASQEDSVFWVANTQTGGFTVYKLEGTTNLQDIGNATLNRSLASNFFLTPGGAASVQIVLTNGTSWVVPADFNIANNTIEAIGGGGGGDFGNTTNGGSGGGGGAAYSKLLNFNPGAGPIPYSIGTAGSGGISGGTAASDGGDTTFNTSSLVAKGGKKGSRTTGGLGGTAAASTGTVKFSGGNGGNGSNTAGPAGKPAGGGGGSAGKFAAGNNGTDAIPGGAQGSGGQGDGTAGGLGGPPTTAGNPGFEWGTVGSGGGGGGFANDFGGSANGGLYGAGGGGGATDSLGNFRAGGNGTQGLIVITYVPATAATDSSAANGYILRTSGHTFYVLNLVNVKETWLYDQQYKTWVKWQSVSSDIWPVVNAVQYAPTGQPQVVVGQDPATGTIWKIDPSIGQDNGSNYEVRVQTSPLTFSTMKRKYYDVVELIGDQQPISTPVLISYSDNDYQTFSTPRTFDMSLVRQFAMNWGNSRRRAWRISYTGSGLFRAIGLEFTIELENS